MVPFSNAFCPNAFLSNAFSPNRCILSFLFALNTYSLRAAGSKFIDLRTVLEVVSEDGMGWKGGGRGFGMGDMYTQG